MERPFGSEHPAMQARVEVALVPWRVAWTWLIREALKREKLD